MSRARNGDLKRYRAVDGYSRNCELLRLGTLVDHPLYEEFGGALADLVWMQPSAPDSPSPRLNRVLERMYRKAYENWKAAQDRLCTHLMKRFEEEFRRRNADFFSEVSKFLRLLNAERGLPLHLAILQAVGTQPRTSEVINLEPGIDLDELRRRINFMRHGSRWIKLSDDCLRQAVQSLGITLIHRRRGRPRRPVGKFR